MVISITGRTQHKRRSSVVAIVGSVVVSVVVIVIVAIAVAPMSKE
jgi:hypothetical protein